MASPNARKLKKLLTARDPAVIRQGVELAVSLEDGALVDELPRRSPVAAERWDSSSTRVAPGRPREDDEQSVHIECAFNVEERWTR